MFGLGSHDTQEPTSTMEVEPQEPNVPHNGTSVKEHSESNIIKDTTTMLKDLAQTVIATTLQVKMPPTLTVSHKVCHLDLQCFTMNQVLHLKCSIR